MAGALLAIHHRLLISGFNAPIHPVDVARNGGPDSSAHVSPSVLLGGREGRLSAQPSLQPAQKRSAGSRRWLRGCRRLGFQSSPARGWESELDRPHGAYRCPDRRHYLAQREPSTPHAWVQLVNHRCGARYCHLSLRQRKPAKHILLVQQGKHP